jgi:hypothetical protein
MVQVPKPTRPPESFTELVRANYFELMNSGKLKADRLKELAFRQTPTTAELAIIANVLDVAEEFVVELRDRTFPKNSKPKQKNGTP